MRQRVEPPRGIHESLRVPCQAEKLTQTKKVGESVARKTHLRREGDAHCDSAAIQSSLDKPAEGRRALRRTDLRPGVRAFPIVEETEFFRDRGETGIAQDPEHAWATEQPQPVAHHR